MVGRLIFAIKDSWVTMILCGLKIKSRLLSRLCLFCCSFDTRRFMVDNRFLITKLFDTINLSLASIVALRQQKS